MNDMRSYLPWLALAVAFGAGVTAVAGVDPGLQWFTAYFVEQALSVDNLFVMMLVFQQFRVPRAGQRRALGWGIAGVIVLRGLMIVSGTALIEQFHALTYVLGAVLLLAAVKLARELDEPDQPDPPPRLGDARIRALVSRIMPITDDFAGSRFTVVRAGVRYATPLLLAVITIELADAVFALDSVPAVFAVTTDRFIVMTSNLLAVLGLRSLYFALAGLLDHLRYLKHGLVGVLGVVGIKMLTSAWWTAPTWLSLVLVANVLGVAIVASLIARRPVLETGGTANAEES